jgi:hypothetical protein
MNILGISGKARSGKDTTAAFLRDKYGFVVLHFSDALYGEAKEVYKYCTLTGNDAVTLENGQIIPIPDYISPEIITNGMKDKDGNFLQWWGTIRRNYFKEDYWIEHVSKTLESLRSKNVENVIVADVRLLNEANFIKSLDGKIMRILRYDGEGNLYIDPSRDARHESEIALDNYQDVDAVLLNEFDVNSIYESAEELIHKLFPTITPTQRR